MRVGSLEIEIMAGMARLQKDMNDAQRIVGGSMANVEKSVNSAKRAMQTLGVGLPLVAIVDQVRRMTDQYTKLDAQLRLSTKTQAQYAQGMVDLRRISSIAQSDINATSMLYTRLMQVTDGMGVSQEKIATITETVSYGLKAYGATAQEAASASLQLSQAMGANRLGGEEFRAVMEAMPNVMKVLAKSMGVPLGELRALSIAGKITAEEMVKAFGDPAIAAQFKQMALNTQTVTGAWVVARNELMLLVGEFGKSSGGVNIFIGAFKAMGEAFALMAQYMQQLISLATVMSVLYAGRYLAAMQSAWMVTRAHTEALVVDAAGEKAHAAVVAYAKAAEAAATTEAATAKKLSATIAKQASADIALAANAEAAAVAAASAVVKKAAAEDAAAVRASAAAIVTAKQVEVNLAREALLATEAETVAKIASTRAIIKQAEATAVAVGFSAKAVAAKNELAFAEANLLRIQEARAVLLQQQVAQEAAGEAQRTAIMAAATTERMAMAEAAAAKEAVLNKARIAQSEAFIAAKHVEALAMNKVYDQQRVAAAAAAAAEEARVAATLSGFAKIRAFAVSNAFGLIGLAMWGAYEIADHLGWIDRVFDSADTRLKKLYEDILRAREIPSQVGRNAPGDAGAFNVVPGLTEDVVKAYFKSVGDVSQDYKNRVQNDSFVFSKDFLSKEQEKAAKAAKIYSDFVAELDKLWAMKGVSEENRTKAEIQLRATYNERLDALNKSERAAIAKLSEAEKAHYEWLKQSGEAQAAREEADMKKRIEGQTEYYDWLAASGEAQAAREEADMKKRIEADKAVADAQLKAAEEQWKMIDGFAHTAFDNIFDKGRDTFKEIGNAIKKYVLDMLYKMSVQKWMISVGIGGGGMGAAGTAQAATGASSFGGMLDVTGLIGGSLGTFGTGIASAMSTGIVAGFGNGMAALGLGQIGAGLGMMAPGLAIGALVLGSLFGGKGTPTSSLGHALTSFDASGAQTGTQSLYGGSSAAVDKQIAEMQSGYMKAAMALGIGATAQTWGFAMNTGKDGKQTMFGLSGGGFEQGETAFSDEALQLAASRAILAALQGSELPGYLANVFDGLSVGTMTQQDINNTMAFAQALKVTRDTLTETRAPMEILAQTVNDGMASLGTSAATFSTDFVAAIDAGLSPEKFAEWSATWGLLKQQQEAAKQALRTTQGLEVQVLELSGNKTEALALQRQMELEGMSATDAALQRRIYFLQDEAAAVEKANAVSAQRFSLEAQYASLTGDNTLSRIAELQALDPANRAIQLRIWALQDEQAAAQSAAQVAQSAAGAYESAGKAHSEYLRGLVNFGTNVQAFLRDLRTGGMMGTPRQTLGAAQEYYTADLTAAKAGDADAQGRLVESARKYIDVAKGMFGSGEQMSAILGQVMADLGGLGAVTELDANIIALNAIEKAVNTGTAATHSVRQAVQTVPFAITEANLKLLDTLSLSFSELDADLSNTLTYPEFLKGMSGKATDAEIRALFDLTDTNHDGVISALEANAVSVGLSFKEWSQGKSGTDAELMATFTALDTNGDQLLSAVEIGNASNATIASNTSDTIRASTYLGALATDQIHYLADIRAALNGTLRVTSRNHLGMPTMFANGGAFTNGIVSSPTAFNIGAMGENGSEAIMPLTNIGGKLGVRAAGGDSKEVVAELRSLKATVARLLEHGNNAVASQTKQVVGAVTNGANKSATATKEAAALAVTN